MFRAYRSYMKAVTWRHIERLSQCDEEGFFLREMAARHGMAWSRPGQFLAQTPQGRFLQRLYPPQLNPWTFEAVLQHYGFPTLALDVTYSPLVALYFATQSFRRQGAVVRAHDISSAGVVYVLSVPCNSPYRRGTIVWQRISDLFDMTLDNFSRPRRQYAGLLHEVAYLELPNAPQPNAYAAFISHVVRFSPSFWLARGTKRFLRANLGPWLLPPVEVDMLFQKLRAASRHWFPIYDLCGAPPTPDAADQFEFTRPRRVVVCGSDAATVSTILQTTWHARMGWLEAIPTDRVLDMASTAGGPEPLDIVIACEPELPDAARLQEVICDTGRSSGRCFVTLCSGARGDARPHHCSRLTLIGTTLYATSNDPYDSDFDLQQGLFDAQVSLSKARFERRMKPKPTQWESFLDWVQSGGAP